MFQSKFNRLIAAGLAAAAVVPTAAVARVATDPVATPQTQDLRAPDQVAPGVKSAPIVVGPPTWPVNPQPIKTAAPTSATSDNGIDDGVLIALGGGAVLLVAGIGVAGRKRLQVVRRRQLA
jgi:hypothetical protein